MVRDYSHYFNDNIVVFLTENNDYWNKKNDSRFNQILNYTKRSNLIMPNQVHGDNLIVVTQKSKDIECDSIIFSSSSDLIGAINIADCVPVFIYDSLSGYLALVHSGWRGTLKKIVIKTINKMISLGATNKSMKIFIGPSIRGCCYKVEDFFASKFYKSCVLKESGEFYVDLKSQIFKDLECALIPKSNIFIDNSCTFEDLNLHSYRRDSVRSGRMSLVAYMRSNG